MIAGAIDYNTNSWRNTYWVASGLFGLLSIVVIFFFPETTFRREPMQLKHVNTRRDIDDSRRQGLLKSLRVFNGSQTDEALVKLFLRPAGSMLLPAVVWGALVYSGTVGFVVAVSTNLPVAFMPPPYLFNVQQIGFTSFAIIIGSSLAFVIGGPLIDWIAARLTVRNKGVREPEMRIPGILVPMILAPVGLVLYGVGVEKHLHWIAPIFGVGMVGFSSVYATNIAFSYVVDCYKPIASETIAGLMSLKSVFGFLISFYTNTWVMHEGYTKAFGEMAGISAAFLAMGIAFYFFGKRIRQGIMTWPVFKQLRWDEDRDDLFDAE